MISEPTLVAVRRQVPTVEAALAALDALEDQLKAAKTYEDLARTIEVARALRTLYDDVLAVKIRAEDVVLTGTRQIGRELRKVRKGHKWQPRQFAGDGTLIQGRAETGIPGSTRARLIRLAEVSDAALRETVPQLRADGRDATPTAVLDAIRRDGKRGPSGGARAGTGGPD